METTEEKQTGGASGTNAADNPNDTAEIKESPAEPDADAFAKAEADGENPNADTESQAADGENPNADTEHQTADGEKNPGADIEHQTPEEILASHGINLTRGRDLATAERRAKRRLRTLSLMCTAFAITTVLFLSLFIYSESKTSANNKFAAYLTAASVRMTEYDSGSFPLEEKYREVVGELASANAICTMTSLSPDEKADISSLYSASTKLPDQVKTNMSRISAAVANISSGDERGWSSLKEILENIDKLDLEEN